MLPAAEFAARRGGGALGAARGAAAATPARVRFTRSPRRRDATSTSPVAPPADVEYLTADEAAREDVMLGLRLTRGVPTARVEAAGLDAGARGTRAPTASSRRAEGRWRTTRRGWLLGNEVFGRVWNARFDTAPGRVNTIRVGTRHREC